MIVATSFTDNEEKLAILRRLVDYGATLNGHQATPKYASPGAAKRRFGDSRVSGDIFEYLIEVYREYRIAEWEYNADFGKA